MKKQVAAVVVLVVVASLSVAGCSGPSTNGSSSNIAITVNSQQVASQIGNGTFAGTPQAGNDFLIFNVTVTNLNENNWPLGNPLYFKLTTGDNAVYSYSSSTYYLGASALKPVSNTNPGETVTGQVAFEIPQSATATTLTYNDGLGGGSYTINLTSPSPTPTPAATPGGHNAVLEQTVSLTAYNENNLKGWTLASWNVIWHNDNSVTMLSTQITNDTKSAWSTNETLLAFPTTQDATNYVNAFDKSNYRLMGTTYNVYMPASTYPVALGHDPQTFQDWSTPAASQTHNISYEIAQWDNIVQFLVSQQL